MHNVANYIRQQHNFITRAKNYAGKEHKYITQITSEDNLTHGKNCGLIKRMCITYTNDLNADLNADHGQVWMKNLQSQNLQSHSSPQQNRLHNRARVLMRHHQPVAP